jgi:hypothetical protein
MGSEASFYKKGGGDMTTYEAISLMLTFGILLIALISYIDGDKKHKK